MKYGYLFAGLAATASAHTWVEQLNLIAHNGTLVGDPGFPRGNVKRGTPGFGDPKMVNLIPPNPRPPNQILESDLMCKDTQTKQKQGDGDRLKATPGANVALRYQENGHVTLPQNQPGKPPNRGTVFVYGTTQPSENDKFLSIHRVWNAEGTGGDKRGILLSTQNFDDSQCYQVNGGQISTQRQKTFAHTAGQLMGADLWCQQDIQIPTSAPSGQPYTLYWVWDWPTMPGTPGFPQGKQEIYTTCMDIDIVQGSGTQNKAVQNSFVKQDLANAAVSAQLAEIANPTAVTGEFIPFSSVPGTPASTGTSSMQMSNFSRAAPYPKHPTPTDPAASSSTSILTSDSSSQITGASVFKPATDASATSTPTATKTGNGSGRPHVSPVTGSSAPFPQATDGQARPNGPGSHPNGPGNNNPQNSGSFISNPSSTTAAPGSVGTVTRYSTVMQTEIQTLFTTVYQSTKAQVVTGPPTVTDSTSPTSSSRCSTTEPAYKLRARNPFYILPSSNVGC